MQIKKVISLILTLVMLLTVAVIPGVYNAAQIDHAGTALNNATDYALAPDIQSGNILHAFNWSMNDLVRYAPEIAAAGYTSVQISPIQKTKVTNYCGSYATDWWSFYQPTDMTIGNALGTEEELQAAVTELHKYGVMVIADVVTNHAQSCKSRDEEKSVAATMRSTSIGARHSLLSHPMIASDNSRQNQVQGDLDGTLPDMNTSNKYYQNYVIDNLLVPLADCGVDGYRFDAAKHIETPYDGSYASDYWPTVTDAIKAKNAYAFIYGEVLDSAGRFNISSYTQFMNVTDWTYGHTVRSALSSQKAASLVNYGYVGSQKSQNVLWVESHDNFCDGTSTALTKSQQILGWAIVGARADAPALFFVRPKHESVEDGNVMYDELMGAPGASDTWKDPTVVAVNRFKNAMAGKIESVSADGSKLYIQRGTEGMVIVNLEGTSAQISHTCSMANGTYTDQVSGNTFTVGQGMISGEVGPTGVAVIYHPTSDNSAPTISLSLNGEELTAESLCRYTSDTATVTVSLGNATGGTVKVSNLDPVDIEDGNIEFTLNSTIPYGKSVEITVTAANGDKTVSRTYQIKKKDPNENKVVYFDNTAMKWPVSSSTGAHIYAYCKSGIDPSTQLAGYDAYQLTAVEGQDDLYYYDVPEKTNYVKFNEGYIDEQYTSESDTDEYGRWHLLHSFSECQGYCGRTMPETVVNYGNAFLKRNRENGGYALSGAMILRGLRFEDYGEYPAAELIDSDISFDVVSGSPNITVYFGNPCGWGDLCVDYWNVDGIPGRYSIAMTPRGEYAGDPYYKADIPMGVQGISFSGGGIQSVDIVEGINHNAIWGFSSKEDNNGHRKVVLIRPGDVQTESPTETSTEEPADPAKAVVSLYGCDGILSERRTFYIGDEFYVYTTFNSTNIYGGKVNHIRGEQQYTDSVLEEIDEKVVDENFGNTTFKELESAFPVTKGNTYVSCDTGKIIFFAYQGYYGAEPFTFDNDNCLLIVTKYKVTASGNATAINRITALSIPEDDFTYIIDEPDAFSHEFTSTSSFSPPAPAPTEAPTEPDDTYMIGDANSDGEVDILDATYIQRYLASYHVDNFDEEAAAVSGDELSIVDATSIQRYLASYADPYHIGERKSRNNS